MTKFEKEKLVQEYLLDNFGNVMFSCFNFDIVYDSTPFRKWLIARQIYRIKEDLIAIFYIREITRWLNDRIQK